MKTLFKPGNPKTSTNRFPIPLLRHRHLVQDTGQGRYGYSIIGHRHTAGTCPSQTVQHMAARKHARPTMDDQIVSGQVFGKVITGHNVNVQSLAELTTQQTRKLHASYIFMLRHVGASLRYQHVGIRTQSNNASAPAGTAGCPPSGGQTKRKKKSAAFAAGKGAPP